MRAVVVLCATLITGCGPSDKEKRVIEELTTKMYTTCMGRFLIDLPRGAVNGSRGSYVLLYYGLGKDFKTVEVTLGEAGMTPEAFVGNVAAKAADIARDDNRKTKKSMLLEHRVIDDHTIYLRYHDSLSSAVGSKHEIHLLRGATHVIVHAISYEGLRDDVEPTAQVQSRLFNLASQIRAYDDPAEAGPGFCLGPIVIASDHDEETASINFPIPSRPDLRLRIFTKALTPNGEMPLLDRMKSGIGEPSPHVLRKGERTLADMKAQEWLGSGENEKGNQVLLFALQSMRNVPSFAHPEMTLRLSSGGQLRDGTGAYVNSSLSPREGMALWDSIVNSVRPRPNAVPTSPTNTSSP
jgi:Tle cognate immunity protein 4 C-terminal domain